MSSIYGITDAPTDNIIATDAPYLDTAAPVETPASPDAAGESAPESAEPTLADLQRQIQELTGVKDKFDALEKERADQAAQAQQAQAQQRSAGITKALQDRANEKINNYGMPQQEAQTESELMGDGIQLRQNSAQWAQQIAQGMAYHLAAEALGDTATVAQVREFRNTLLQYPDPISMQNAAKHLAPAMKLGHAALTANQQAQQRQAAIANGATRVEGGERVGTGSGGTDQDVVNRLARGDTMSKGEIARARDAMSKGIYPA